MSVPILFFRGINSFADDHLHLGPVPLWKMGRNIQKHVHGPERKLILVENIGCSTFEEEAERAEKFIRALPFEKFHILAHSAGGIVAKFLLNSSSLARKTLSLTTIGTPHQGSFLAELIDELRFTGYDEKRRALFHRLRTKDLQQITKNLFLPPHIQTQSVLCTSSQDTFSWPVKMVAKAFKNYEIKEESDGFVQLSSQRYGRVLGHYELDHLEEIGFIFRMNPRPRQAHFRQMLEVINTSWQQIESVLV